MSEQYISLLGMLLGVALFIYLIFKKYPLPVGSVLGAIVVAIFSGMPVMTSLTDPLLARAARAFKSYLLLLIFSAIFGKVLGDVGACQSIAYKMARLVKKLWPGHEKFLGVMAMGLITCVFCYGGISVFVVIFTLIYIGKELYEELDIPWYMLTVTGMGTGTFAASMIPGSPQLVNIVPMEYYGTPAYAAPVLGMICAVFSFAFTCWWISFKVKRITKRGEGFYPSANEFMKTWTDKERVEEQPLWKCLLPSVVLIVILNATSLGTVAACWGGIITTAILFGPTKIHWAEDCVASVGNAAGSLTALAAATGFGGVVSASPAYSMIIDGLMSLPGSGVWKVIIAINVVCGICGSGSTGLRVTLASLGDYFMTLGIPANALHRLSAITACGLDTLPHSAGMSTTYVLGKISYKDGYINHFMITVVGTLLTTVLCAVLILLGITF